MCKSNLSLVACVCHRSDLNASSGMASTLQQLASSSQWHPSIADHVGLCLERLAQPAAEVLLTFPHSCLSVGRDVSQCSSLTSFLSYPPLLSFIINPRLYKFIDLRVVDRGRICSQHLTVIFWLCSLQNVELSAVFGLLVFARFPDVSMKSNIRRG